MQEAGHVLYESGHVVDVTVVTLGDELDGDHADGATSLTVGDSVDFSEGGVVLIDGVTYDVTDVDYDTDTITITPGLSGAKDDGETVDVWDPLYQMVSSYKSVQVRVLSEDSNEDIIEAVLASHLVDKLGEGIRGVHGESVLVEMDGDEWRVCDVLGHGDPNAGLGSGTLFKIDEFIVTEAGDQSFTLTYEPLPDSEHVYWNGDEQEGEYTLNERVVTMLDPDERLKEGDSVDVKYAYRAGRLDPVVPEPPEPENPWLLLPPGEPTLFEGLGTSGPSLVGSGDVWIDETGSGALIYAVNNALGRDGASIQLPSNTGLPTDDAGLQLRLHLTITSTPSANLFQNVYVRISSNSGGNSVMFQTILVGAATHSVVLTPVFGTSFDAFLSLMAADDPVWIVITLDRNVAPIGEEGGIITECYLQLEEI